MNFSIKGIIADIIYELSVVIKRIRNHGYKRKLIKNGLSIGSNSYLDEGVLIYRPRNVKIGSNVHINANSHLYANHGYISIGDNVTISAECRFIASGYELTKWKEHDIREHFEGKEIFINKNNWICSGATILPGVKVLGEHVVIAAGAVVTKNIEESGVIVGGVPARVIKKIEN